MSLPFLGRFDLWVLFALAMGGSPLHARAQDAPAWAVLTDEAELMSSSGDFASSAVILRRASALAEADAAPAAARGHIDLALGAALAEQGMTDDALAAFARALDASVRPSGARPRTQATFALALALRADASTTTPEAVTPAVADPADADPADAATADAAEADTADAEAADADTADIDADLPIEETPRDALELTVSMGISGGFSWIEPGLPADTARPEGFGDTSPWMNCDARGEACTVRVSGAGFGSTVSVVASVLLSPIDGLALGLALHAQPNSGSGFLAGWLLDATVRGRPIEPHTFPLDLELVGAVGLGQLQVRPAQDETELGPFVQSGPGSVTGGAALVVKVERGVEIVLDVLGRFAFPTFVPTLETDLVLRIAP